MSESEIPTPYLRWSRLCEIKRGGETVELMASACEYGIAVIARWLKSGSHWAVEALDTEGQEWRAVTEFHECESVPPEPPLIWTDALERELAALKAEREWRPIETAPKDGRSVLVWSRDRGVEKKKFCSTIKRWLDFIGSGDWGCTPTHWQPLPPAPATEGGVAAKNLVTVLQKTLEGIQ